MLMQGLLLRDRTDWSPSDQAVLGKHLDSKQRHAPVPMAAIGLYLQVSAGGTVRDPKIHQKVIETVTAGIVAAGFTSSGCIESPLKGAAGGNTEFLAHFQRQEAPQQAMPG